MKRLINIGLWSALLGVLTLTGGCYLHNGHHEVRAGNYRHHW
jgi:hypothetical protein